MTAKQEILEKLSTASGWLALHEFNIYGHNQAAISARLRNLNDEGKVVGRYRKECNYKEWSIKPAVRFEGEQGVM